MITTAPDLKACWDYLAGLQFEIDRREIDQIDWLWVEDALAESPDPDIENSLEGLCYDDLAGFAADLRDHLHNMLDTWADLMSTARQECYDYE